MERVFVGPRRRDLSAEARGRSKTGVLQGRYNSFMSHRHSVLAVLLAIVASGDVWSADATTLPPPVESRREDTAGQPMGESQTGVASSTLGGKYFWSDEFVYHDWRIQRNALDGHYRLLDPKGRRLASGSARECQAKFEKIRREQKLPPLSGKVVLVLHGLGRTRISNSGMTQYLREKTNYTVLSVGYASTQAPIARHAEMLARVIDNLGTDVTEINFVAHSLGNLVIRHYLADHTNEKTGETPDRRIKRIVMVGAPNNGAHMAELVGRNWLFEAMVGESGRAIASGWQELQKHLAIPSVEFAIIAGGKLDGQGYNPLVPGDDDLVLAVEETKLAGASDFVIVPALHALMMDHEEVQAAALRFLEDGHLVAKDKRHPIPGERGVGE